MRVADPLGEVTGDRLPGGAPHHLAAERRDDQGVVAVRGTGPPIGALRPQPFGDGVVIGQLVQREPGVRTDQAGLVGQQLAQRDVPLALHR